MKTASKSIWKWFFRIGFIVGVVLVGFQLEEKLQASRNEFQPEVPKDQYDIVMAGGSITKGLPAPTEHYLRELAGHKNIIVSPLTRLRMSSGDALNILEVDFSSRRPKALVVMLGMSEDEKFVPKKSLGFGLNIFRSHWEKLFPQVPERNRGSYSVEQLIYLIEHKNFALLDNIHQRSVQNKIEFITGNFFFDIQIAIVHSLIYFDDDILLKKWREEVLKKIRLFLPKAKNSDRDVINAYIELCDQGIYLETMVRLWHNQSAWYEEAGKKWNAHTDGRIEFLKTRIWELDRSLRKYLTLASPEFCSSDEVEEGQSIFEKLWICLTLDGDYSQDRSDFAQFMERHHDEFARGFPFLNYSARLIPKDLRPKLGKIPFYFDRYIPLILDQKQFDVPPGHVEQLRKNLKILQTETERLGIKLVLMHYPNVRYPSLDQIAAEFGIHIIGDEKLFVKLIEKDGYSTYFVDQANGSGHMTVAGVNIYGKYIAGKLLELMPELRTPKSENK